MRTLYVQDYRDHQFSAAAPGGRVLIREAAHPNRVDVNVEFQWYVVGHVYDGEVPYPAVGYVYVDGPADSITIVEVGGGELRLPKGYAAVMYYRTTKGPCEGVDSRLAFRGAKVPAPGTYSIKLVSGYLSPEEAASGARVAGELYALIVSGLELLPRASALARAVRAVARATRGGALGPLALGALLLAV